MQKVVVKLLSPSARAIRDTRVQMQRDWELANNAPCETVVHRGFDIIENCQVATITCRSILPANYTWSEQ